MRLRRVHADFLARQRVVHVATADARGRPHVVPVCAVLVDGRLYFASGKSGRKIDHLLMVPAGGLVQFVLLRRRLAHLIESEEADSGADNP